MARFVVKGDVGVLDRGEGESNRFVVVDGVDVDELGKLSAASWAKVASVMSNETVKNGATRIKDSDCVVFDFDKINPGENDRVYSYNGGDVIYDTYENASDIRKFLIDKSILVPENKK